MAKVEFAEALKEFETSLADIEANFNFVTAASWLRPRLGGLLNWDNLDPEGKGGAQRFMKQSSVQIDLLYRGMLVALAGAFEQLVRRILRDSVTQISAATPQYNRINAKLVLQNVLRTGQALATVADPPDHLELNYELLCRNAGTCFVDSESAVLNADAFALFFSTMTPAKLGDILRRIGVELNWDAMGRDSELQAVFELRKTRETAAAVQDYLKEFIRTRNRLAHTGSGGRTTTDADIAVALRFFRAFARTLTSVVSDSLKAL